MSIKSEDELRALKAVGAVVARTLREMRRYVRPGVTTGELDAVAARVFTSAGARSGPQLDYNFPGSTCISVNDEAVHGIPGRRRLREGDLVKLDVTAELDGFYADACTSVAVGRARPRDARLLVAANAALRSGIEAAKAGGPVNAIGQAVEREVTGRGFSVCDGLAGHGIGRRIHEPPNVPNVYEADLADRLTESLVLTIEPIIAAGGGAVHMTSDGWTVATDDGSASAHAEHTVVITDGRPLVLTA
jgi:methionyl aminopeptidase